MPKNEDENDDYHRILGKTFYLGIAGEEITGSKKWYNLNDKSEITWAKWIVHNGGEEGQGTGQEFANSRKFDASDPVPDITKKHGWKDDRSEYDLSTVNDLHGFVKDWAPFVCEKEPSHRCK